MSWLYKFKNSLVGDITKTQITAAGGDPDAETKFYKPFKTRAAEIKEIVEKHSKPLNGLVRDTKYEKEFLPLVTCEDTKA